MTRRPLHDIAHSLSNISILWIIDTFRELGPPDLCHVTKTTGRGGSKDVSNTNGVVNSIDLIDMTRF